MHVLVDRTPLLLTAPRCWFMSHHMIPACRTAPPLRRPFAAGGKYQARLRSLCQFTNATDMALEVALLEEEDAAWTLLPHAAGSAAAGSLSGASGGRPALGDVVEEEVFEYERYVPLRGWSADNLRGLDPHRYSRQRDGRRGTDTFPKVPLPQVRGLAVAAAAAAAGNGCCCMHASTSMWLCSACARRHACTCSMPHQMHARMPGTHKASSRAPRLHPHAQGWEWEGPWEVETTGNVDADGWAYGFDVGQLSWPPPPGSGIKKAHDFVRR